MHASRIWSAKNATWKNVSSDSSSTELLPRCAFSRIRSETKIGVAVQWFRLAKSNFLDLYGKKPYIYRRTKEDAMLPDSHKSAKPPKATRIDARLSGDLKELLERAALLQGRTV